eukprot:2577527-Prymnesium_polylepis.1
MASRGDLTWGHMGSHGADITSLTPRRVMALPATKLRSTSPMICASPEDSSPTAQGSHSHGVTWGHMGSHGVTWGHM